MINKEDIMIASRRRFLFGAGASAVGLVAAPAIVRVAANLMPISTAALQEELFQVVVTTTPYRSLLTNDIILREAIMHLNNNLVAAKLFRRDLSLSFKAGDLITISRPSTSRLLT